jgi:hypothetical protein
MKIIKYYKIDLREERWKKKGLLVVAVQIVTNAVLSLGVFVWVAKVDMIQEKGI